MSYRVQLAVPLEMPLREHDADTMLDALQHACEVLQRVTEVQGSGLRVEFVPDRELVLNLRLTTARPAEPSAYLTIEKVT